MAASFSTSAGMSRRTSGSPPVKRTLSIPRRHGDPHEPLDLLEAQQGRARQELDLLGHAVDAPDVATVRHTDPQVIVRSSKRVDQSVWW